MKTRFRHGDTPPRLCRWPPSSSPCSPPALASPASRRSDEREEEGRYLSLPYPLLPAFSSPLPAFPAPSCSVRRRRRRGGPLPSSCSATRRWWRGAPADGCVLLQRGARGTPCGLMRRGAAGHPGAPPSLWSCKILLCPRRAHASPCDDHPSGLIFYIGDHGAVGFPHFTMQLRAEPGRSRKPAMAYTEDAPKFLINIRCHSPFKYLQICWDSSSSSQFI